MKVRIKRIDTTLPLPQYETPGAVAFDFVARESVEILARNMGRVPANVVVEIPEGYMLWVTDRSSTLKKKGLLITEGVIDQDYCGDADEILLQFYNPTDVRITVERGERLAQGVFLPVGIAQWEEVGQMGNASRGGFGSTDGPKKEPIPIPVRVESASVGKLIVLYGINNLGKSTQAQLLVGRLRKEGRKAECVKYLVYDKEPSGPMINEYLRGGNPHQLWPREFQLLGALNKYHYQPTLEEKLNAGTWVVAEDYSGTGIAWGMGAGVDKKFLERIHEGIRKEDIAFLFDGERFLEASEKNHEHEANQALIQQVRGIHQELGKEYGWITINANQSIDVISELIWERVSRVLQ